MTTDTATTKKRTTRTLAERVEHNRAQIAEWTKSRLAKIDAKIDKHRADVRELEIERTNILNATKPAGER